MSKTTDTIIRNTLITQLKTEHSKDPKVRIIEEFGLKHGQSRIDVAVINGIMQGYEIKSDADTLKRLPLQIKAYNSVFDKITLVVGKTHLHEAIKITPNWWGIIIAKKIKKQPVSLINIREGKINPSQNIISIIQLLWKEETLKVLEDLNADKGLRSKPKIFACKKLASIINHEKIKAVVRENILFTRKDWRPDAPLTINDG